MQIFKIFYQTLSCVAVLKDQFLIISQWLRWQAEESIKIITSAWHWEISESLVHSLSQTHVASIWSARALLLPKRVNNPQTLIFVNVSAQIAQASIPGKSNKFIQMIIIQAAVRIKIRFMTNLEIGTKKWLGINDWIRNGENHILNMQGLYLLETGEEKKSQEV